jgi:TonB family protein
MNITREKTTGFIGSVIFCLLIFLILYFTVLYTKVKSGEEGVLVSFGTVDLSAGTFSPDKGNEPTITEPAPSKPEPEPVKPQIPKQEAQLSVPKTQPKPNTPPITQNIEETAAIEAAKRKQQEKERVEAEQRAAKAKAEEEQRAAKAKAEEEQRKRDAINQQVSGAFGSGSGSSGQQNQGTGQTGSGLQGNPQSASTSGAPAGSGGYGEFNLGGRTLGAGGLPRPTYSVQEEGRIVINITVDPRGNVIFAEIGKGTNIDNGNMRSAALEAARKARFNSINGNNNQTGTITYKYSLR